MIKDYESGKWDFDITTIVKNIKVEVPCPKYVCKRGFTKRLCLTITNDDLFLKEFDRYLNGYIRPAQELSKKEEHIYKVTRLAEILYGNLNHGYWVDLVKT